MDSDLEPLPGAQQPVALAKDSVGWGCLFGCLSQMLFFALAFLIVTKMPRISHGVLVLMSWGVTQWILIGPLIWYHKSKGYSRTTQGLIITGCIGVLLSSGCAVMSRSWGLG